MWLLKEQIALIKYCLKKYVLGLIAYSNPFCSHSHCPKIFKKHQKYHSIKFNGKAYDPHCFFQGWLVVDHGIQASQKRDCPHGVPPGFGNQYPKELLKFEFGSAPHHREKPFASILYLCFCSDQTYKLLMWCLLDALLRWLCWDPLIPWRHGPEVKWKNIYRFKHITFPSFQINLYIKYSVIRIVNCRTQFQDTTGFPYVIVFNIINLKNSTNIQIHVYKPRCEWY